VYAGISAAAPGKIEAVAEHLFYRILNRLLYGNSVFLHLPAVVMAAVKLQVQAYVAHIFPHINVDN